MGHNMKIFRTEIIPFINRDKVRKGRTWKRLWLQQKRKLYIKYLLMLVAALIFCLLMDQYVRERAVSEESGDFVRIEELCGYLQVIPLTPSETRSLIVNQLLGDSVENEDLGISDETAQYSTSAESTKEANKEETNLSDGVSEQGGNGNTVTRKSDDYLTADDIEWLFAYLKLGELSETVGQDLKAIGNGSVSRKTWCAVYEEMLDILGIRDEVEIIDIQYLGMLLEDGHLMADSGNYECDTESVDFVYGETYHVYVWGNVLLGLAAQEEGGADGEDDVGQGTDEPENEEAEGQDGTSGDGAGDDTITELPETVRVLLTQDNEKAIYRENVYLKSEGELSVSIKALDGVSDQSVADAGETKNVDGQSGEAEIIPGNQVVDCLAWMNQNGVDEMVVSLSNDEGILADAESVTVDVESVTADVESVTADVESVTTDGEEDSNNGMDVSLDGEDTGADAENIVQDTGIFITDNNGTAVSSAYSGTLHIYKDENGMRVVNEVSLETYLCGVVPGEMPESFAEEALKAQAVCARTYAARLVSEKKYESYGADLNDTTDCQVYLPSEENEKANEAVSATAGQVLTAQGELAVIYYFSTSCGLTSGLEVWQTEGVDYLTTVSLLTDSQSQSVSLGEATAYDDFLRRTDIEAYDSHSRYFRWTAKLDVSGRLAEVKDALKEEIEKGNGRIGVEDTSGTGIASVENLGGFSGMEVVSRNEAGMVTDFALTFENGRVHLYHENVIRTVLGKAMISLADKNGESVNTLTILPSAAFSVETADGQMTLYGGGLGHGIGMSQYGADGMAQAGMGYEEILETFFPGAVVQAW